MSDIAIGDIHGSAAALSTLLDALDISNNRLIFLGDYVDRGPASRQVLDALLQLSCDPRHVFLRGNHDEWLLRARDEKRWFKTWIGEGVGGKETLRSYGAASFVPSSLALMPDAHFGFLERTQLFFQTEFEIFVHASIGWQEPEESDPQQLLWRSFDEIAPHPSGKRIICGHTSQLSGLPADRGHAVCIDTFCSGASWLSALDVDSDEVVQADSNGRSRRFRLGESPAAMA